MGHAVYNKIWIRGPARILQPLHDAMMNQRFLDEMIPMPEDIRQSSDWRQKDEWAHENWGFEAYDIGMVGYEGCANECSLSTASNLLAPIEFTASFMTKSSAPEKCIETWAKGRIECDVIYDYQTPELPIAGRLHSESGRVRKVGFPAYDPRGLAEEYIHDDDSEEISTSFGQTVSDRWRSESSDDGSSQSSHDSMYH